MLVIAVVVFTTRSVLRRLKDLHDRTVTVAEETLPDVVARLQRGEAVGADALPQPTAGQLPQDRASSPGSRNCGRSLFKEPQQSARAWSGALGDSGSLREAV
ncbi:hypothetical protein ABZV31_36650 [Streptomyces sp. NPDC005202]|uniref:hypothetical protein n=1 Tax=Streptomyces sp. NPDC005202 TaxID=3157021 RepID=UPI0033A7B223